MALVKCPDCGKLVSERATVCPDCGCPAGFFVGTDELPKKDTEIEMVEEPEKEYIYFELLNGKKIRWAKDDVSYVKLYGEFVLRADSARKAMYETYDSQGSMEDTLRRVPEVGNRLINAAFDRAVAYLYSNGVCTTVAQLIEDSSGDYDFDYAGYVNTIANEYGKILDEKSQMDYNREIEKASRSRWSGGGFGLKGAIKGAIQADLLNAGSDFLHSFGDKARAASDQYEIDKKFENLRAQASTKEQMCDPVPFIIMQIFDAAADELASSGKIQQHPTMQNNYKQARVLFESCMAHESNLVDLENKLIDCIALYPGEIDFYAPIYEELGAEQNDFRTFIDFWGIESLFTNIKENAYYEKVVTDLKLEESAKEYGLGIESMLNFTKTNVYDLVKKYILYQHEKHENNAVLKHHLNVFLSRIQPSIWLNDEIFSLIPGDIDFQEGLSYILDFIKCLLEDVPCDLFPNIDPEKEKYITKHIKDDETVVVRYCIKPWFHHVGYVITNKRVISLNHKKSVVIDGSETIRYDNDQSFTLQNSKGAIAFYGIEHSLHYPSDDIASYVGYCILKIAEYARTGTLQLSLPETNEKISLNDIIKTSVNDKSEKIEVAANVAQEDKTVNSNIFCPFCGKQILRTAKFCNFCGKQNNYNK